MLEPKKVKYRKQQKGRRAGMALRGSTLAFGDYGLKALIFRGEVLTEEEQQQKAAMGG